MMADDLTLTVGDRAISGWESIRVTRGAERCPSDFDIALTERFPGESNAIVVKPGDACKVELGGDLVITGYIDRFHAAIAPHMHTVRVIGRGKCQDLVDCAAEWKGGQITGSSALQIAQNLALPYKGLTVSAAQVDVGPPIPQIQLILGETAFEIIERVCRYRGLLAYELPDGNLFLSQVGTEAAASGFIEGQNVQAAAIEYSMDQCYSEYRALLQSVERYDDLGDGGNLITTVPDEGVPRHRRMVIIAEAAGVVGADICTQRARWEAARRMGRANQLRLTTDSWRDAGGVLWAPNTLVPLSLPSLKLPQATWVIGDVTYRRDENGTTAELLLMPPNAFLPQPFAWPPFFSEIPPAPASPTP